MSAVTTEPAAGDAIVASAQIFEQRNVVIADPTGLAPATFGEVSIAGDPYRQAFRVSALPYIRISMFHYPEYDRGDFVFAARNDITWRLVAIAAGRATPFANLVGIKTSIPVSGPWVPISTPQLLPVGQPINLTVETGGYAGVAIEFDSSAGVPAVNQGFDRIIVTVSAGA